MSDLRDTINANLQKEEKSFKKLVHHWFKFFLYETTLFDRESEQDAYDDAYEMAQALAAYKVNPMHTPEWLAEWIGEEKARVIRQYVGR